MAKKIDLSVFDDAVKESGGSKNIDLSSFDEAKGTNISPLQSAAEGFASGATVAKPVVAGISQTLMNALTGVISPSDILENYRHNRDTEKASQEKILAANPKSAIAGQLVGGIAPAIAMGGASIPGEASSALKIANAMKTGAEYGAASGMLNGNADFAQAAQNVGQGNFRGALGQVGQGIQDTVQGAGEGLITGGLIGTGAQVLGAGAKALGNTKLGKYFSKGKKGVNLSDLPTQEEALAEGSKELGKGVLETRTALINGDYETAKSALKSSSLKTDIKGTLTNYLDKAKELEEGGNPGEPLYEEAQKIKEFVMNRLEGKETPILASKYIPQSIEETPFTPSGLTKVKNKLQILVQNAKDKGQELKTNIEPYVTEDGQKMLRGSYWEDVPDTTEPVLPKVKGSWDNSTDGLQSAQKKLAMLRSKAALEQNNTKYGLVPDNNNGLYHVVENPHPSTVINEANPSALQGSPNVIEGSSNISHLPPQADTPAIQATSQTFPAQRGPEFQVGSYRPGANTDFSPNDLLQLKTQLQGQLEGMGTTQGQNVIKQFLGDVNDLLQTNGGSQWRSTDAKYRAVNLAKDFLGLSPEDMILNPQTGQKELSPQAFAKLRNTIRNAGASENTTQGNASYKLQNALDQLKKANPELAEQLAPKLQEAGENYDMAREVGGVGITHGLKHQGLLNWAMANTEKVANKAGLGVNTAQKELGYLVNGVFKLPAQKLLQIADEVSTTGEAGQQIGNILKEAANRDSVGKNALLFSMMQNPAYRDVLHKYIEKLMP